jgi:hypothetical protein
LDRDEELSRASRRRRLDGARFELALGVPYWDGERLEWWGLILSDKGKKKRRRRRRRRRNDKTGNKTEVETAARDGIEGEGEDRSLIPE